MLTPDLSPVHRLAEQWFREERKPSPFQVPERRIKLLQACLAQIREHKRLQIAEYNPFVDNRYRWASEYLNHVANPSNPICEDLTFAARSLFAPAADFISGKSLAAHDT